MALESVKTKAAEAQQSLKETLQKFAKISKSSVPRPPGAHYPNAPIPYASSVPRPPGAHWGNAPIGAASPTTPHTGMYGGVPWSSAGVPNPSIPGAAPLPGSVTPTPGMQKIPGGPKGPGFKPTSGWKNFAKTGGGMGFGSLALGAGSQYAPEPLKTPMEVGSKALIAGSVAGTAASVPWASKFLQAKNFKPLVAGAKVGPAGAAAIGYGAFDLGTRALGHATNNWVGSTEGGMDSIKRMFDRLDGYSGEKYKEGSVGGLKSVMDQNGLSEDEQNEVFSMVDDWAENGKYDENGQPEFEGDWQDAGQPAIDAGIQYVIKTAEDNKAEAVDLMYQRATYQLLKQIQGPALDRATASLRRTQRNIEHVPPHLRASMLKAAELRADIAFKTADAYVAQAAVQPEWNRLMKESEMAQQARDEIRRSEILVEEYAKAGLDPNELPGTT